MKKFLIFLIFLSFLSAKIVDRVIASVNGEPITSYEITNTVTSLNVSPKEALNILINQKIIDEEIKKRGIEVDEFDIENALEKIAHQNKMSVFEFKALLKQRGELNKFMNNLREDLLKQKLFSQIVNSKLKVTPKELKNYYINHKNEFKTFKKIDVTEYISKNPEDLKKIAKNHLFFLDNVTVKTSTFNSNDLPINLVFLFNSTKEGSFTPILNDNDKYIMFYINKKEGNDILPFEKVKNIIANKLIEQKRNSILKEYFNTLRNQADIELFK